MAGAPSPRTKVRRHPERAAYDREAAIAILDEGLVCHLGVVDGGTPFAIPTMYARRGDWLYVHGSPLSRMLRSAQEGAAVCLTVTLLDGLVLARSVFNHSMNYRSVMVLGRAVPVTDPEEKMAASQALVEHVCRGRWEDARHPDPKELGATLILRLPLDEASVKTRTGGPKDGAEDLRRPTWAGELPLRTRPRAAVPHEALQEGSPPPAYVARYRRPGWE